jgi:hypothetical protein
MVKTKANLVIDDKLLLSNAESEISRLKLLLKQALMKIEQMTQVHGQYSANLFSDEPIKQSGGVALEGLKLEDGETNDEVNKVLLENKALRKENNLLLKELREMKNGFVARAAKRSVAHSKGSYDRDRDRGAHNQSTPMKRGATSRSHRKSKPEWAVRASDDSKFRESGADRYEPSTTPSP